MKKHIKPLAAIILCAAAAIAAPTPKIIFDTDMVEDYDDVGAMAVLHALADEGKCEILAMATCTRDNSSVAAVEIFNVFYGRPDIPVGCAKEMGVVGVPGGSPERRSHQKFVRLASEYPQWVKHPNSNDAPDANNIYRRALANAPDKSVTFVSVGFVTNMRRLLETKGDEISPLDGRALVAKKVVRWFAMACRAPKGKEYNAMWDAESSKIAFENWPTPIVFSDWDLGRDIYSGRTVAETSYPYPNPVKDVFARSLPPRDKIATGKCEEKSEEGRCSWDEVTVFAAVHNIGRFFNVEHGTFRMSPDGSDEWIPDPKNRNCRLLIAEGKPRQNYPNWAIGHLLDELIAREPMCRRTDEAITARRRSSLESTPTGVRLLRDGKTLWNLEIDTPEGRPFFHPLNLPSGRTFTDLRPKDHIWHLGWWFSWKFINGVNYWEPADAKRAGAEPEGRTRVVKKRVSKNGLDCIVALALEYGPRTEKEPTLREERTIEIDPPDVKGGYVINVRHRFTALKDATLDRTPPHGSTASGKWGGGYAGATLRLAKSAADSFVTKGFSGGTSPAAVTDGETKFVDFTDPATGEGVTFTQVAAPESSRFYMWPDKRMTNPSPIYDAPLTLKNGETLELAYRLSVHADRRVKGVLAERPREKMSRGLVASVTPRGTYVSWRLLEEDAPSAAFDLWRRAGGKTEKINPAPIVQTSDYFIPGFTDPSAEYSLDGRNFTPVRGICEQGLACVRIPLADTNSTVAAAAVGDLDGDGEYDYVVKTPSGGTDPWDLVWRPAKDTYKLEAHTADGRLLWRRDLGWNIEMGVWYSPFIVADLDGDGKAEVIAKTAPLSPDFRDPDGRVQRGPELLTVIDGLSGRDICSTPWIPRAAPDHVAEYNAFASRNQIALAHLDGKTPCVVIERGTYNKMVVEAYCMKDRRLERVWRWNNEFLPSRLRGQGDHACLCEDVDGDGCDEVLIGSLVLDHDGTVLWCNARGHSDAHYYGDIDPLRPGMELAFIYETAQRKGGGLLMTDPVTGGEIWKLPVPTRHVHSCGICADIDPVHPGLEFYGQEVDQSNSSTTNTHPQSDNRWLYTASGELIAAYTNCTFRYGNGVRVAFWDADLQREVFQGRLKDHAGTPVTTRTPNPLLVADLFGDWREEFVAGAKGELRIYTTDIPAIDRRVSLMRDPSYRSRVTMEPSGYAQQPIMQYVPSSRSPNLSLRIATDWRSCTIDVTAPLDAPLKGVLKFDGLPDKWSVDLPPQTIDLAPGGLWTRHVPFRRPPNPRGRYNFRLTLERPDAPPLVLHQPAVN